MKKAQQIKRARRLITGIIISWTDPTPLVASDTITNEGVTHRRPVLRLQAGTIWSDYGKWITANPVLLWRIDITVVFRYPNGRDQFEERRVIARGRLHDIAHECQPVIEAAMRYGATPLETRFSVECLGDRSAVEADFGDYEAA